jgi:hypothetical protein
MSEAARRLSTEVKKESECWYSSSASPSSISLIVSIKRASKSLPRLSSLF